MAQQQEPEMTLEQIEAHIESANLEQYDSLRAEGMAAAGAQQDLSGQLQKVCGIYRGIRPVLKVLLSFPLIPGSIKKALKTFVNVMDSICPA